MAKRCKMVLCSKRDSRLFPALSGGGTIGQEKIPPGEVHKNSLSNVTPLYTFSLGSAKLTGGAPGLQIRCEGVKAFSGGFDSHALPPPVSFSPGKECLPSIPQARKSPAAGAPASHPRPRQEACRGVSPVARSAWGRSHIVIFIHQRGA